jgi:hypothetical protein
MRSIIIESALLDDTPRDVTPEIRVLATNQIRRVARIIRSRRQVWQPQRLVRRRRRNIDRVPTPLARFGDIVGTRAERETLWGRSPRVL